MNPYELERLAKQHTGGLVPGGCLTNVAGVLLRQPLELVWVHVQVLS